MSISRHVGYFRKDSRQLSAHIQAAYTMIVGASTVAMLAIITAAPYLTSRMPEGTVTLLVISSASVFGSAFVQFSKGISFGRLDSRTANIYEAVDLTFRFLLTIAGMAIARDRLFGAILGYTAASLIAGTIILYHSFRTSGIRFRWLWSGQLFTYAWPVGVSEAVTSASNIAMMVLLSRESGPGGVGYYGVGMALSSLVFFVPQLVLPVFLPAVTIRYARNLNVRSDVANGRIFISIPAGLTAAALILLIRPVTDRLFGPHYQEATLPASILIAAHALYVIMVWIPRQTLDMAGKTRSNLTLTVIRSAASLTLAWLLVPKSGPTGAALAVATGWIIEGIVAGVWSKRVLSVQKRIHRGTIAQSSPE
jgi:O-antigen/teichoic acid export membrane protein